jgi:membrane-associated phospholipid phosphatase
VIAEVILSASLAAALATPQAPATPVATAPASAAPTQTGKELPSLEQEFLKNFLRDQKAIWTSPYHIRSADAKWLVPLIAGTATFILTDRRISDHFAENPELIHVGDVVSYFGSAYVIGASAATFYLVGRLNHDARARETALLVTEALVDASVVHSVVKFVAERSRPDAGAIRGEFFTGGVSFPSGHTMHFWSFATVVAHEYAQYRWVPYAAYGTAAIVGAARVAAQRHYLSDVLVGGALGYAIGKYVYRTHQRLDRGGVTAPASRISWPAIDVQYAPAAHEYGLRLTWTGR